MSIEHPDRSEKNIEHPDYSNEDVVQAILAKGTDDQVEAFRTFSMLSQEQIEFLRYYAQLRLAVHLHKAEELAVRIRDNTKPTNEELSAGAYWEQIEPQVRKAIQIMRQKGYPTYESGFFGDQQKISFESDGFTENAISKELIESLLARGIAVQVTNKSIILSFNTIMSLDTIIDAWNEIANALPDRGHEVELSMTGQARSFRNKWLAK